MKAKPKHNVKQAEKFLADLQSRNFPTFEHIAQLLTMYESREVDKETAFSSIVNEIKQNPAVLRQFNDFLLPEKRVQVIPLSKIQEMLTFLLEELNKKYSNYPEKFHSFIDFFYLMSKDRIDSVCFTSYPEMVTYTLDEIHRSAEIQELGLDFIVDIEEIMRQYLNKVLSEPPVYVEPEPELPSPPNAPETTEAVPTGNQGVTTTAAKKPKSRANAPPIPETVNLKAPAPASQTIPSAKPKQPEPAFEEPTSDNLKGDESVFVVLARKLSHLEYKCLIKNLFLYMKNVISYFEFVKLSENLLIKVEKEVCMALKDMVEGRERSRTANNLFNIKLQLKELDNKAENRSYKRIITTELNVGANEHALINKSYMATAHGNESAVNFEEGIHKKIVKNVSEEALFRVEDEIHEFDAVLHQTQVALNWIRMLQAKGTDQGRVSKICQKLANIRILNYLYGNKGSQIIEELKTRPPELLELVEKRLREKIDVLQVARREFAEKNWQASQNGSYYKALDARSNSLKFAEKRFFNNKGFLGKLKDNDKAEQVIWGDSLAALLGHSKTQTIALAMFESTQRIFWNPIICFPLKEKKIMSDIIFFLKLFVKLSKISGAEKERVQLFVERALCSFLRIPAAQHAFEGPLPSRERFVEAIEGFEKRLYPRKDFYYCDKLNVKVDENNYVPANDYLQSLESKKSPPGNGKNKGPYTPMETKDKMAAERASQQKTALPVEMIIEHQEVDPDARSFFYASQTFYLIYQYFILLYERFEYADRFSKSVFQNESLYELFKQVLFMHLFGVLDIGQYEDVIRMLFDHQSGVFLNFDKLFHNCVKHIPNDDFTNFVMGLNKSIFDSQLGLPTMTEDVLFSKTYAKLLDQFAASNKASKSNVATNVSSNSAASDLLKFEIDFLRSMFIVHKIKIPNESEVKTSNIYLHASIEELYPTMTRPLSAEATSKLNGRFKKNVSNNIIHYYNVKRRELVFAKSATEDKIIGGHREASSDARKRRIFKLKKIKQFREARQSKLKANF